MGMDRGPRMQHRAAISAVKVMVFVFIAFVFIVLLPIGMSLKLIIPVALFSIILAQIILLKYLYMSNKAALRINADAALYAV